jgi:RecJ-like exonuclease
MTFQLQSQTVPPDRKKELEKLLSALQRSVDSVQILITQPQENQEKQLSTAMHTIDSQLEQMGTLFHLMNAENEELRTVTGKLRKQRDDAIRAREQVLAYLRQIKKPLP